MAEEVKDVAVPEEELEFETEFAIGGTTYQVHTPKGRAGRKATGFFMSRVGLGSEGEDQDFTDKIMQVVSDDEFDRHHLHVFLGVPKKMLEEEGTFMEILNAVMITFGALSASMEEEEVEAAIKNSKPTQAAD